MGELIWPYAKKENITHFCAQTVHVLQDLTLKWHSNNPLSTEQES